MKFSLSNTYASAVLICALLSPVLPAQALVPDETTTITLDQAVHFIGTDGSDVVADPGDYSVEVAQEWLRLIPGTERRSALLIEAQPGTHEVKVETPIVISTPGTEPDETDVHIVQFLNPDGTSLVATGTYSGIQSRGFLADKRKAAEAPLLDALSQTIVVPQDVHFTDTEGQDIIVPAGAFWVMPNVDLLELFSLENGQTLAIAASQAQHEESLTNPVVVSIPGGEDHPDTHIIAVMFAFGSQMAAVGSYSGIRSRGELDMDALLASTSVQVEKQQRTFAKYNALLVGESAKMAASEEFADASDVDALNRTIQMSKAVHFNGVEGDDTLVPVGAYMVTNEDDTLELLSLETGKVYALAAGSGEHNIELDKLVAVSSPGKDEEPDVHAVELMFTDGTLLAAEGSYSGIRSRGLGGKALARARAARAAARKRVAHAKAKAKQLQVAYNRKKDAEAKVAIRDIALMLKSGKKDAAKKKLAKDSLLLGGYYRRQVPPQLRSQLIARALQEGKNHRQFIEKALQILKSAPPGLMRSAIDGRLADEEYGQLYDHLWDKAKGLQDPFANSGVRSRSVYEDLDIGISRTMGASLDAAIVLGAGWGTKLAVVPLPPPYSVIFEKCLYETHSIGLGTQVGVSFNADAGVFFGNPSEFGGSNPNAEPDIYDETSHSTDITVTLGGAYYVGAEVGFVFEPDPSEGPWGMKFSGIEISPSVGMEVDVGIEIGFEFLKGCGLGI